MGISNFIYTAAVTEINEIIINKIENMIYNFIWRERKAKIKRKTLIGKYSSGGWQAAGIDSIINVQRIVWIKRYLDDGSNFWKLTLNYYLNMASAC